MNTNDISLKGLPYVPLLPQWMLECEAFHSDDPCVVRAAFKMLAYAWQSTPAASIPSDFKGIARVCGLDEIAVGEHYDALTGGWELRSDRLHHVAMSELASRMVASHGDVLEKLADRAAAVMQAPEDFALVGCEPTSRAKGRHLLPASFVLTDERRSWLASFVKIIDPDDQVFVFEKFRTHMHRSNEKYNDWESTFRNFALKENIRNLPSRNGTTVPLVNAGAGGRVMRYGTRGEAAQSHNASVMEATRSRAHG